MDDWSKASEDSLRKAVGEMIPKSIGDIIRQNRDKAALSMATLTDIGELIGDIESNLITNTMTDWRIGKLSFSGSPDSPSPTSAFLLLGDIAGHGSRSTSYIQRIDFKRSRVMTKNSIYALGKVGDGEPHKDQLIALCAYLHQSPAGKFLGVPHFFY